MLEVMVAVTAVLVIVVLVLLVVLLRRPAQAVDLAPPFAALDKRLEGIDRTFRDELARNREESATAARQGREELSAALRSFAESVTGQMTQIAGGQKAQLEAFAGQLATLTQTNEQRLETLRQAVETKLTQLQVDANQNAAASREAAAKSLTGFCDTLLARMTEVVAFQKAQFDTFAAGLKTLTEANNLNLTQLREGVERKLAGLQADATQHQVTTRDENAKNAKALTETLVKSVDTFCNQTLARMAEAVTFQKSQFDTFAVGLKGLTETNNQNLTALRDGVERKLGNLQSDATQHQALARDEQAKAAKALADALMARLAEGAAQQKEQLEKFSAAINGLTASSEQKLEKVRETVEGRLTALQTDNAAKLEQIRLTVDEKLHATLEQRLGESFKLVSERLEMVHKGLGEMQSLANGVGDLKKVLSNIKTRGTWGEVQLGNLLEQMLTPDQYEKNAQVNPESLDRVEFAIRLPGKDVIGRPILLPIDAKFPQEDYQRLVDAAERGEAEMVAASAEALEARVYGEAKKIRDKYICPPHSTDFAILFLPTEGLFAEVLRRPGLCDSILREFRVVLTGPTTLAAVLSSLQMGFRTLAIEKRSSEVWQVLGAVKTEFTKFGDVLEKVQKKLQEASNTVDAAATRSRVLERKLKGVEAVPEDKVARLLGGGDGLGAMDLGADRSRPLGVALSDEISPLNS